AALRPLFSEVSTPYGRQSDLHSSTRQKYGDAVILVSMFGDRWNDYVNEIGISNVQFQVFRDVSPLDLKSLGSKILEAKNVSPEEQRLLARHWSGLSPETRQHSLQKLLPVLDVFDRIKPEIENRHKYSALNLVGFAHGIDAVAVTAEILSRNADAISDLHQLIDENKLAQALTFWKVNSNLPVSAINKILQGYPVSSQSTLAASLAYTQMFNELRSQVKLKRRGKRTSTFDNELTEKQLSKFESNFEQFYKKDITELLDLSGNLYQAVSHHQSLSDRELVLLSHALSKLSEAQKVSMVPEISQVNFSRALNLLDSTIVEKSRQLIDIGVGIHTIDAALTSEQTASVVQALKLTNHFESLEKQIWLYSMQLNGVSMKEAGDVLSMLSPARARELGAWLLSHPTLKIEDIADVASSWLYTSEFLTKLNDNPNFAVSLTKALKHLVTQNPKANDLSLKQALEVLQLFKDSEMSGPDLQVLSAVLHSNSDVSKQLIQGVLTPADVISSMEGFRIDPTFSHEIASIVSAIEPKFFWKKLAARQIWQTLDKNTQSNSAQLIHAFQAELAKLDLKGKEHENLTRAVLGASNTQDAVKAAFTSLRTEDQLKLITALDGTELNQETKNQIVSKLNIGMFLKALSDLGHEKDAPELSLRLTYIFGSDYKKWLALREKTDASLSVSDVVSWLPLDPNIERNSYKNFLFKNHERLRDRNLEVEVSQELYDVHVDWEENQRLAQRENLDNQSNTRSTREHDFEEEQAYRERDYEREHEDNYDGEHARDYGDEEYHDSGAENADYAGRLVQIEGFEIRANSIDESKTLKMSGPAGLALAGKYWHALQNPDLHGGTLESALRTALLEIDSILDPNLVRTLGSRLVEGLSAEDFKIAQTSRIISKRTPSLLPTDLIVDLGAYELKFLSRNDPDFPLVALGNEVGNCIQPGNAGDEVGKFLQEHPDAGALVLRTKKGKRIVAGSPAMVDASNNVFLEGIDGKMPGVESTNKDIIDLRNHRALVVKAYDEMGKKLMERGFNRMVVLQFSGNPHEGGFMSARDWPSHWNLLDKNERIEPHPDNHGHNENTPERKQLVVAKNENPSKRENRHNFWAEAPRKGEDYGDDYEPVKSFKGIEDARERV
ncbi:MAG: hypothetical protein K2X81_24885, partial [Candidatus Obscuribacterales bacterium]|nr:hypothetical protein [Candidatus Obscuribacterales bacterium]